MWNNRPQRGVSPARVPMLDPTLTAQLAAILPAEALLTTAETVRPYECDGLTLFREQPAAVLLP
jgi:glycolate oxidase